MVRKEKNLTVMYIDDSAGDRKVFKEILKSINPCINYAPLRDGQSALDYLSNEKLHKPDCIFLDLTMPSMDGIECLQKIKKIKGAKHIPVITYSASHVVSIAEAAKLLGAEACLRKEADVEKAADKVADALNEFVIATRLKP